MADVIKISGAVIRIQERGSKKMRMRDIAIRVGGTPRRVDLPSTSIMFINDNQKLEKRMLNRSASSIFTGLGDIYGDVIFCEEDEIED